MQTATSRHSTSKIYASSNPQICLSFWYDLHVKLPFKLTVSEAVSTFRDKQKNSFPFIACSNVAILGLQGVAAAWCVLDTDHKLQKPRISPKGSTENLSPRKFYFSGVDYVQGIETIMDKDIIIGGPHCELMNRLQSCTWCSFLK